MATAGDPSPRLCTTLKCRQRFVVHAGFLKSTFACFKSFKDPPARIEESRQKVPAIVVDTQVEEHLQSY